MKLQRPAIGRTVLSVLVATYVLFLNNFTFWSKTSGHFAGNPAMLAVLGAAVLLLYIVFLIAFSADENLVPRLGPGDRQNDVSESDDALRRNRSVSEG